MLPNPTNKATIILQLKAVHQATIIIVFKVVHQITQMKDKMKKVISIIALKKMELIQQRLTKITPRLAIQQHILLMLKFRTVK